MTKDKPETIVCAANRLNEDGRIILGIRHCDMFMHSAVKSGELLKSEQGFITNRGRFLGRHEALEMVKDDPRFEKEVPIKDKLFSEDMY